MAGQTNPGDGSEPDIPAEPPAYEPRESRANHAERPRSYGRMYAAECDWDNPTCTRMAYGDSPATSAPGKRSLRFHTTWMDAAEAMQALKEVPPYNRFRSEPVARVIDRLSAHNSYAVGREGSPVLYVWTAEPKAAYDALRKLERDDFPPEAHDDHSCGPDELGCFIDPDSFPPRGVGGDPIPDSDMLIRAWWD